eukprot:1451515-Amphidinium_carterae.1
MDIPVPEDDDDIVPDGRTWEEVTAAGELQEFDEGEEDDLEEEEDVTDYSVGDTRNRHYILERSSFQKEKLK